MKGRGSSSPLHPNNKWNTLHHFIKDRRLAIIALQETHLDEENVNRLSNLYGRRLAIYASHSTNATSKGGVATVINRDMVNVDHVTATEIIPGRALLLEISWHEDVVLRVLNVYAPNDYLENATFWKKLEDEWRHLHRPRPDAVLGDFNVVEDSLDRFPHRRDEFQAVSALQSLLSYFRLKDGWRETHTGILEYSFPVQQKDMKSRLDRIYVTNKLLKLAENWTIEISQVNTDHRMVTAQITDTKAPFLGPGRWSLPIDLITDKEFKEKVVSKTIELKKKVRDCYKKRTSVNNPQALFKAYKDDIAKSARERLKTKVPKVKKAIDKLNEDLEKIKANPETNSNESLQTTLRLVEGKIAHLMLMSNQSRRIATTARYRLEGETVSKYWTSINKGKSPRDLIYSFEKPNSNPPEYERRSDKMAMLARNYHEQLQTHTPPRGEVNRITSIGAVCAAIPTKYEDCPRNNMMELTSEDDVLAAIKASENGRAAGVNGIPYELWKTLARMYEELHSNDKQPQSQEEREKSDEADIVWILTKVYNDIELFEILPHTEFALGWLCPLYKKKGDKRKIASYRPITLLNSDYKILTKVLAMKLAVVAPSLIHEDQAGFVPGRQIFHQIRQAQLTIDFAEAVEQNGVIIALDQEKAYDKIMHDYLWRILDAYHIPQRFSSTMKNLYAEANTIVFVNGERSTPFKVTRGVRQGCPLSCLIFNLAIEPLACLLRSSRLKGIRVPGLPERLIASLFADDTTAYLAEEDSLEDLDQILDLWTEASGGMFNASKTEVIPIGSPQYREQVRMWRAPNNVSKKFPPGVDVLREGATIRILGARLGNHPDPTAAWQPILKAITESLERWSRCHPSLNGRRLITQMVVGGKTQFLAKAQGMPPEVEEEVIHIIRSFMWDGAKKPSVNLDTLYFPKNLGGLKLLDIKSRNQAIHLTWMKDYLNMGKQRPKWAYIADALISRAITKRNSHVDQDAKINTFIQNWDINLHSQKILPRELRQMLSVARKFDVRLDTLKLPPNLKKKLPIWFHIGAEQKLHRITKDSTGQCLRKHHGVSTVESVLEVTRRRTTMTRDRTGRLRKHLPRKNCACSFCVQDRQNGCPDPNKCCETARKLITLLFPKYAPDMNPPNDNLSLTKHQKEANEAAYENDDMITFDPSITDPEDISQTIRVFTSPRDDLSSKLPALRPRRMRQTTEELTVYTDSSSLENGDENSRVGSGIWFGENDNRNASIRIGRPEATNQTGELIAVLVAAQRAPPDSILHIICDSKYVINGLTRHLPKWEGKGWIDVKNADIFQAIVTTLRQRSARTTFQWVKGHADIYGNEQADKLAGEGAKKSMPDNVDLSVHPGFILTGAKLASISQALAYRGIRQRVVQNLRKKTESNAKAVQLAIEKETDRRHPVSTIWKSIHSPDIGKPIQDFLWKGLHGAHKVGTHWSYVPNCEDRILCAVCEREDSMQHILCDCKAPGPHLAWKLAEALWRRKGKPWKPITLNTILGAGLMSFSEDKTPRKGGPDRLYRILITETAYLIWKLRCERVIGNTDEAPYSHSTVEIAHRWMAALNTRLALDRQMTRKGLSKRAISNHLVKSTWTKVIENEEALPEDWLKAKEVLVGSVDQEVLLNLEIDESHTTG